MDITISYLGEGRLAFLKIIYLQINNRLIIQN